jgi:hypothetical protein
VVGLVQAADAVQQQQRPTAFQRSTSQLHLMAGWRKANKKSDGFIKREKRPQSISRFFNFFLSRFSLRSLFSHEALDTATLQPNRTSSYLRLVYCCTAVLAPDLSRLDNKLSMAYSK